MRGTLPSRVAGVPHEFAHRRVIIGDGQPARHTRLAKTLRVHAGHQTASAGTAGWIGDVGHRAFGSALSERVDVRSGDARVTEAGEISVAEVIDEEDDDVGLFAPRFLSDTGVGVQAGSHYASSGGSKEVTSVGLVHWKTESLADLFG